MSRHYKKNGKKYPSCTTIISDCTDHRGWAFQWASNECVAWIRENCSFSPDAAGLYNINSIELDREDHWMIGTQFHPEFKSRPYAPSKVYYDFINECVRYKNKRNGI